jgi:creatinine amidohydrolase/Fe(II)-dependent formamide hydrolase-like protein
MRGAWLEDLTWPQAREWIAAGRVIVLPVGAISKEHGHHLPLNTDYLLARAFARGVLDALPVLAAPVVSAGYYPAFRHYPGSQHLEPTTFQAVIEETIENFIAQGAVKLAIINTGVSTEPVIRIAVREILERSGIRVPVADIRRLGKSADLLMQQKLGGHGDEHETSLMLAIKPEAVRMDEAQTDYGHLLDAPRTVFDLPAIFDPNPASGIDYSAAGIRGDPTLASAEKGRAVLAATVRDLVEGLQLLYPEAVQ